VNERLSTMQETDSKPYEASATCKRVRFRAKRKRRNRDGRRGFAATEFYYRQSGPSYGGDPCQWLPGFTVSVEARRAYLAQQICSEITSFFMQQNLLLRERRAEQTIVFISKQLEESKRRLDDQDGKLANFQRRYMGNSPRRCKRISAFWRVWPPVGSCFPGSQSGAAG